MMCLECCFTRNHYSTIYEPQKGKSTHLVIGIKNRTLPLENGHVMIMYGSILYSNHYAIRNTDAKAYGIVSAMIGIYKLIEFPYDPSGHG